MPPPPAPPDEWEFDQPGILQGFPVPGLYPENNLFFYFGNSPWMDPTSNNASLFATLRVGDPARCEAVMNTRKLWEERLDALPVGVQFVLAGEGQGEDHPWLLQRQNKVEVPGEEGKESHIETFVEGNYYTHGTKMLMAPSLLDIVQARLLTISTRMQQVAELSKSITHWSPATGYSNYPPSYEAPKAATTASRIGSPTLAPTEPEVAGSQSQGAGATAPVAVADTVASETEFSDALFMHSLNLTNAFGDEYMDENPLKGEPGAFVFENTRTAVNARNKAQDEAAQATQGAPAARLRIDTQPPSVAPSVVATPKAAATPVAIEALSRKGSVAPAPKKKKDRRKSQAGLASPTTPSVP